MNRNEKPDEKLDTAADTAAVPGGGMDPGTAAPEPEAEHDVEARQAEEREREVPGDPVAQATGKQARKPEAASAALEDEPAPVVAAEAGPNDPENAGDVFTKKMPGHEAGDAVVLAESRVHTRRSFAIAAVAAAAGYGFYEWVDRSPGRQMLQAPLRDALRTNAALSRGVFDERALAPTYPLSRAENMRTNGVYGLKESLLPESWRLQLVGSRGAVGNPRYTKDVTAWEYRYSTAPPTGDKGHDTKVAPKADTAKKMAPAPMVGEESVKEERGGQEPRGREEAGQSSSMLPPGTPGLLLTLEDIKVLPRYELVTQFKCIEGWSQISQWAGVRLADLIEAYPPEKLNGREPRYVYMETPNGDYYCGFDMDACRHPQSLLVTEMMGQPLTQYHGAPLRLHMPIKYGYKQIKRIGLIAYTNKKPDDYWTRLGYDWYAGL